MGIREDKVYYRTKVGNLIKDNPIKYPTTTEAVELSVIHGSFIHVSFSLAAVMDSCFNENMPIAECARRIEEVCKIAKDSAFTLYELVTRSPDETVH